MIDYFDIGYPKKFGESHIGLYQPMIRCFLLTVCDIQQARDIILIAGARYPLYPVNLVTAANYSENLIDNYCCENWELPESQIMSTTTNTYVDHYVDAENLVLRNNHLPGMDDEKNYLQLIWYGVRLIEQWNITNVYAWKVKQFMHDVFGHSDKQYEFAQNIRKQIINELFYTEDINSTKLVLESIVSKAQKDYDTVF
jgi:hypothetical protein